LSAISDAVFLTDDAGHFTYICPNVDVIFGYVPDEVQAMVSIDALLGPQLFEPKRLAAEREIANIECDVVTKSGEPRSLLVHVKAVEIMGGTVLYCCRDVTAHKRAHEALQTARLDLVHASRFALVGELAASIAHEVNQPLQSIVSNASAGISILERQKPPNLKTLTEILVDIDELGHRAAGVIARIQALARKRPPEFEMVDMRELVAETLRIVEADARRRRIALRADSQADLPKIEADKIWLQQVLLNLALNGMDAMQDVPPRDRTLDVRAWSSTGTVEISVSDTGHGIARDQLPKLFDAFFTTKNQGVGLGLAVARSIVEAHRGKIWAIDHAGRGATFRLSLPTQQSPSIAAA
jgi:PAS domain S-box-containing protein